MKDAKEIFINSTIGSTRIAILNNNMLSDLYIERPDHKKMVGNIYNGKVQNIIPGMQAAFIDIGFHINAFLPFSEIIDKNSINESIFESDNKKLKWRTVGVSSNIIDASVMALSDGFSWCLLHEKN